MVARLLYGLLLIASLAMILFILGFIGFKLGIVWLSVLLYAIAGKVLLLVFALLLLLGFVLITHSIVADLRSYFVKEAMAKRQVLFMQNKKQHFARLSAFKSQQLYYFHQFKRQRLLAADDKKQRAKLYAAINEELIAIKHKMPVKHYQLWQKTLRRYHKQADANAMLALREQIKLCQ